MYETPGRAENGAAFRIEKETASKRACDFV